jgi:hypothetical protein
MANANTVLEKFRVKLDGCLAPIEINEYRDDLVRDLANLCCSDCPEVDHLKELNNELKITEQNVTELEREQGQSKRNKMEWAERRRMIDVQRKKIVELAREINHLLAKSDAIVLNQKRVKIEVERLDTIIFKVRDIF